MPPQFDDTLRTADRSSREAPADSPNVDGAESPSSPAPGVAATRDAEHRVTPPRLRAVLAPAFATDNEGRIVSVNDRLASLLNLEPGSAIGRPCSEICLGPIDGDLTQGARCDLTVHLRPGEESEPCTVALLKSSGQSLTARITAIACEDGFLIVVGVNGGPAPVRVSCLGAFSARLPGGLSLQPRRPKALTLLKLLVAARPHPVADVRIVGALWPSGSLARNLRSLRVLVHDLRHALEPGLTDGRASRFVTRLSASYSIPEDAPLEVDIEQFLNASRAARSAAAAGRFAQAEQQVLTAVELYKGDLFASDAAASWFVTDRRRLKSTWLDMLTLHAELLRRDGRDSEALEQVQRIVDADFVREDAHRLLLLLLAGSRGRDAALQHFVEMAAAFKARFGLPPSRETAALVSALRRGDDLRDVESAHIPADDPTRIARPVDPT